MSWPKESPLVDYGGFVAPGAMLGVPVLSMAGDVWTRRIHGVQAHQSD
jgi:hypothetical protein